MHYQWDLAPLPVLPGIQIPPVSAGILTLTCYTGASYAWIFRGGIISIERGQWDAAKALALRRWDAIRRTIPPFVNQSVTQLKSTSWISNSALLDLLYNGSPITADTYRPLEVYTVVAAIYLVLLFPGTPVLRRHERQLAARPR